MEGFGGAKQAARIGQSPGQLTRAVAEPSQLESGSSPIGLPIPPWC
jgi:hypothetical protein